MAQALMERLRMAFGPAFERHAALLCGMRSQHICSPTAPICRAIQDLLGHESLSTTQTYTSVEAKKILQRIGARIRVRERKTRAQSRCAP
jgi:integrase/recombinase XerC